MTQPDGEGAALTDADIDLDALEDRQLVEFARHDADAFLALMHRHVRAVYTFAYRRTQSSSRANTVTTATFERALLAFDTFRWQRGGMLPWLLCIADGCAAATTIDAEEPSVALDALEERTRAAVALRFLAHVDTKDAATAVRCAPTTYALLVRKGVHRLRGAPEAETPAAPVAPLPNDVVSEAL